MSGICKPPSEHRAEKVFKAGKVTRNPFLNFLREYRSKQSGKSVLQIASEAAAIWRKMDEKDREPYIKQACAAPKHARKRKASRCRGHGGKRHHSRSSSRSRSRGRSRHRSASSCSEKKSHGRSQKRHKSRKSAAGGHNTRSKARKAKGAGCVTGARHKKRGGARKGRKGGKSAGARGGRKKSRKSHASKCSSRRRYSTVW